MKKLLFIAIMLLGTLPDKVNAQQEIKLKGKQLFGDISARQIGPALMSGRINDLENHPTNDRIIYAGTAGGGVWKSNDGGITFNSIFDDYSQSIGAVELDPNDPDNTIPEPGTFIAHSVHPVCTFRPVPEYPAMASQAGVEGRVILQVFISPEGIPVEAVIAASSGLGSMDDAAMASVMESSWSPAKRADGVPVGVWTSVVYDFVLN